MNVSPGINNVKNRVIKSVMSSSNCTDKVPVLM